MEAQLFIHLFLAVFSLCCCSRAFSSLGEQQLLSSCSGQASHSRGFSCREAWALRRPGSVVVAQGVVQGMWNVPRPETQPASLRLHWQADLQPLDHQGSPRHNLDKQVLIRFIPVISLGLKHYFSN